MGNLCSGGLLDTDTNHHTGLYNDYAKYTAPHPLGNQVNNSIEQKRSSHSSSPERRRQGHRDGLNVAADEQEVQQDDTPWRSPPAAPEQLPAEAVGQDELDEDPPEPFSWTKGELIGIGAFGRVFSALNNVTGELVAVKQVSFAKDEALQGRVAEHIRALEAEVQVLKTLKHENIVRYLGTEITGDSLYIFLEFVPGGSIASLLAKFGPFPEKVIRMYTAQLLRGLEYLHQKGIMHRDIKGANILVDKQGTVKLADFGASKKIEDLATMGSGSKSIRGTPYWMAPEVIKQTGHGRPADIWSLACTVIEMATGKPPWNNYTAPVAAMFQIASSKDPPPLPEHLSREAKDFLLLCFNRVARDRANATRLLKHPFVAGVLDQSRPLPTPNTPPASAVGNSSSSPGAPANGGHTPHRVLAGSSAAAAGEMMGSSRAGMQHSARQSMGVTANGVSCHRQAVPGAMSAAQAAMKASRQSRSSPTHARNSPMRQQQHPTSDIVGSALCQRGDAAAVVTATRSPLQPHPQQLALQQQQKLQQEHAQQKQQQQSPKPFDTYRQPQQQQQSAPQQPAPQHQQQQGGITRPSPPPAVSAEASGCSDGGQEGCMTLVNWNPVSEPSWLPPYHTNQSDSSKRQQPAQPDSSQQQQQQQQTAPDKQPNGFSNRYPATAAAPEPPDAEGHRAAGAGGSSSSRGPGSISCSSGSHGTGAGQQVKRIPAPTSSSSLSNGTSSKRGLANGAAGPLSQGPAGRASSIMNGTLGPGGSILGGVGSAKQKPRPSGLQGSLQQQQQPSAGTTGSPHNAVGSVSGSAPVPAVEDPAACHDQMGARASAVQADDDVDISSKRIQWENELYEELERHRKEQRVARQASQAARLSAMQH